MNAAVVFTILASFTSGDMRIGEFKTRKDCETALMWQLPELISTSTGFKSAMCIERSEKKP